MKTTNFLSLLMLSLVVLTSCGNTNKKEVQEQGQTISKIEVLDFHSTHRCITCNAIEANTKHTLETYFNKELKEGKITFQVINVDEKGNEKIAEKFEASGTSLFLNVIKNGKEQQINLTEFAFMNGKNKEKFSTELKAKIEKELANL